MDPAGFCLGSCYGLTLLISSTTFLSSSRVAFILSRPESFIPNALNLFIASMGLSASSSIPYQLTSPTGIPVLNRLKVLI